MSVLTSYLQQVQQCASSSETTLFYATQQDRRAMLSCLMGITKTELEGRIQDTLLQLQIERTKALCESLPKVPVDGAPNYLSELDCLDIGDAPLRFLSKLATGRTYKGQFDVLLNNIAPDLMEQYENIVSINRTGVLQVLIEREDKRDDLLRVMELDLPPDPPQPQDSGIQAGKSNENSLLEYLESERVDDSGAILTSHVLVKPQNSSKKSNDIVYIKTSAIQARSTGEFDAMIIKVLEDDEDIIQIEQLWEAKKSLHPLTISDVLFKKYLSLCAILGDKSARFCINDKAYKIKGAMFPAIGIFGRSVLPPEIASRRLERMVFQKRLSQDPDFVRELLENNGRAMLAASTETTLERLLEQIHCHEPLVVVRGKVWSPR